MGNHTIEQKPLAPHEIGPDPLKPPEEKPVIRAKLDRVESLSIELREMSSHINSILISGGQEESQKEGNGNISEMPVTDRIDYLENNLKEVSSILRKTIQRL